MADNGVQSLIPSLVSLGEQLVGRKAALFSLYTLFVYDYFLTLPDEITHIWKKKYSLVTALFFINRYYGFLIFTLNMLSAVDTLFNPKLCQHFAAALPFAGGLILTFSPNTILALRVYALYGKNRIVAALLVLFISAELGVALWIYGTPGAHPLSVPPQVANSPIFHLCTELESSSLGNLQMAAFQFMQTSYDTVVFGLIAFKAVESALRRPESSRKIQTIVARQGVLYYAMLFSANFTWAMMIIFAPTGLKYAPAPLTLILACIMVNRITISLRSFSSRSNPDVNTEIGMDAPLQFPKIWHPRSTILPTVTEASHKSEISESTLRNDSYELRTRSRLEILVNVEVNRT